METTDSLVFLIVAGGTLCLCCGVIAMLRGFLSTPSVLSKLALLSAAGAQIAALCVTVFRNLISAEEVVKPLLPLWTMPAKPQSGAEFAVAFATITILLWPMANRQLVASKRAAAGFVAAVAMLVLYRGAWVREPILLTPDMCEADSTPGAEQIFCDEAGAPKPGGVCHSWVLSNALVTVVLPDGRAAHVHASKPQSRAALDAARGASKGG